jgi:pantoate--beta-alanine ligase
MPATPDIITDKNAMRAWSRAHRAAGRTIGFVPTMVGDGRARPIEMQHLTLLSVFLMCFLLTLLCRAASTRATCPWLTSPSTFKRLRETRKCACERKRDASIHPSSSPFSPNHFLNRREADVIVVSIYVNPTQFAAHEDFGVYPRTRDADRAALAGAGVDCIFEPATLYEAGHVHGPPSTTAPDAALVVGASSTPAPGAHETTVTVSRLQRGLCGGSRPHFFAGVATVVAKLFNCVEPDTAVFGRKDAQQLAVIARMARDLDFGVRVVGGPIVREVDGLALSSRNALLSPGDRAAAPAIAAALAWAARTAAAGVVSSADLETSVSARIAAAKAEGVRVDYVALVDAEDLTAVARVGPGGGWAAGDGGDVIAPPPRPVLLAVAAFIGSVRLIDNTVLGAEVDGGLAGLAAE